jgi:hypothetical protein
LHHVFACGELFDEKVELPSGIDLWGGRNCADGTWSYGGPDKLTTLAPADGVPLRVIGGQDQEATSMLFGVRVVAADASAPDGKSSIAMILSDGAKVNLRWSEILAGNGKDGEPGEDAPSLRAQDGVLGNDGADACSADTVTGAPPAVTKCDDGTESTGGYGGDGQIDVGGDGVQGTPAPAENPAGDGGGGLGAASGTCEKGSRGSTT